MRGARFALPLLALSMGRLRRPAAGRGVPLFVRGPTEPLASGCGSSQLPTDAVVRSPWSTPRPAAVRFAPTVTTARCLPVASHPNRLFYSRKEMRALKAAALADQLTTGRGTLQPRSAWRAEQRQTAARDHSATATAPTAR